MTPQSWAEATGDTAPGPTNHPDGGGTLVDVVSRWAALCPDRPAYTFVSDGKEQTLTFRELELRSLSLANELRDQGLEGERALLLYPSGLDFVVAFFACLYAGVIAVPVPPGRSKGMKLRLGAIVRDCQPRALLTTAPYADVTRDLAPQDGPRRLMAIVTDREWEAPARGAPPPSDPEAFAFLQYTSGSTADPKGTAITHGNILANQRMLQQVFGTDESTVVVTWLPLFHDMGLIGMMLHGAYLGARVVLLPTLAVLKQPLVWLRAVERFRGTFAAAPNFAFDLCVDRTTEDERRSLDLSSWKVAVNGSEPVRHATALRFIETFAVSSFAASSFCPAYGLAEATLVVSASVGRSPRFLEVDAARFAADEVTPPRDSANTRRLVGCGVFDLGDQTLRIVDPDTLRARRDGEIGEIWLAGSHIARGYFGNPTATAERFGARLPGDVRSYLRTGDLGFVRDEDLFITGRIKDLIIVRGQKVYPQDVELTIEQASRAIRRGFVAAFGVETEDGQDVIVMAEVEARHLATPELLQHIVAEIRRAHELPLRRVRLVAKGSIFKTTSGKIQRARCRQAYLEDASTVYAEWSDASADSASPAKAQETSILTSDVAAHARRWIAERCLLDAERLDPHAQLAEFGLDSVSRLELIQALEKQFGRPIPEAAAHELNTIDELARFVAGEAGKSKSSRPPVVASSEPQGTADVVLPAFSSLPWEER